MAKTAASMYALHNCRMQCMQTPQKMCAFPAAVFAASKQIKHRKYKFIYIHITEVCEYWL